jgi:glycosyltransferase involved in cell wall biosynthesis
MTISVVPPCEDDVDECAGKDRGRGEPDWVAYPSTEEGEGWRVAQSIRDVTEEFTTTHDSLRIALVAPPMKAVPPDGYGGTERVVAALATGLHARGHQVTVYATGDSDVPCRLVPTMPRSLWACGYRGDVSAYMQVAAARVWRDSRQFDIIHSHLESHGFLLARHCGTPVVSTLHGRLDNSGLPNLLEEFADIPLVAISGSQRRFWPRLNWVATVHHGLALAAVPHREQPGDYLALVGRVTPEKGIADAIELAARTSMPLKMAAKVHDQAEIDMFESVVRPAIESGLVDFQGELQPDRRDLLLAGARATLRLGAWPEPFGLVAIESHATGTPVIGRRAGALPELIEHGVDGYLVDDLVEAELAVRLVADLDRRRIRARAIERFSIERMVRDYETVYRRLIGACDSTAVVASPSAGALAGIAATSGSGNANRNGHGSHSSPTGAGSR